MAENIKGTNISSPIAPFTSADTYPTHFAEYGKGGYRSVNSIADLDKIPEARREEGMLVYVKNDESGVHTYQYINGSWVRNKLVPGAGIPVYDQNMIDKLGDDAEPDYVHIPNKNTDLNGEITNNTYTTTDNGTYVDILFKALRELQSEVARLRNAFDYGIHSYTGKDTAMSRVEGEYEGDVEEEPLWSIEENSLSEIEGASLAMDVTGAQTLYPSENVNTTTDGVLVINNEGASWLDSRCAKAVEDVKDPKLFLYLTTNSNTVTIKMKDMDGGDETFEIDLSQLRISALDIYNYLIVLSRKQEIEDDRDGSISYKGKNYVWISIGNPKTDSTIVEGYYNNGDIVSNLEELDTRFTFSEVEFRNLKLSKCRFYSKYQDFSKEVIPSKPTDDNYTYKAAHITIRSVDKFTTLSSIQNQLPENELIFVEDLKRLYIKNNYTLIAIGGSTNPEDTGMTQEEVLNLLAQMGIVAKNGDTGELSIATLSDITFIHEDTGKMFKFEVDAYGDLKSTELGGETLAERIESSKVTLTDNTWRGLVGQLRLKEQNNKSVETGESALTQTQDIGLYSDRVKIGAFYAPARTNTTFGCSHGYIELENTSDADFQLDGCFMHYVRSIDNAYRVSHLPLKGTIPAGGTFLIRGKQYANLDDPNVFIKVGTYDMEWYENGELIDFSHNGIVTENSSGTKVGSDPHGFCLTYGKEDLDYSTSVWSNNDGDNKSKAPYLYKSYYIDSVYYNSAITSTSGAYWTTANMNMNMIVGGVFVDAIYKNTFELDPAKQAYQSLNTYDSSRVRHGSANDYQYVRLDNEVISFPKTTETYPVSKFTPKASFEKKNVLTDKNKLDPNKPNMVTCSFGINPYTTRTFNWVSAGLFDEYVWIKDGNSWTKFSSYTRVTTANTEGTSYPRRKEFSVDVNNIIYARMYGHFPGDEASSYTAHKCILALRASAPSSPETYTYVVGRANKDGNAPDTNHCSNEMTFTLYPDSYIPRIYQTTDQQGFHWIEYQSWGAAAQKVNERINADKTATPNILPVLMNTGDMTQSGARVNEWVDYYNAGINLFDHLEQVNVVGNNDLCGTDFTILGTGDDIGKSNSYYFHVFYCYEVDTTAGSIPIINGKYVPSLYYIDFKNYRLIMVNSEITYENCNNWFNVKSNGQVVNVYTGWTVPTTGEPTFYSGFTSVYTMLYNMTNTTKEMIIACHEMPFTVITKENLEDTAKIKNASRSLSGTSLVGSHLNQLNANDTVGIYWFSRLLEFRGIRLCLGGHKHTYSCTYPVMENYLYKDSASDSTYKSSLVNGPMTMNQTLEHDNLVNWIGDVVINTTTTYTDAHLSKFPLTKRPNNPGAGSGFFYPMKYVSDFVGGNAGVIYLMCQATGFKLMSNKELPSPNQAFSRLLPQSTYNGSSAKASPEQRYPMYVIVDLGSSNITVKLIRLKNIQAAPTKLFSQYEYGTAATQEQYLYENYNWASSTWQIDAGDVISTVATDSTWKYGSWTTTETAIISISK